MKIQINSKEALDRLIGDDQDIKMEIKNTILNEITGKYLKSIAHSEIMTEVENRIRREKSKGDFFGFFNDKGWKYTLSPDAEKKIKEMIGRTIDDIVTETVHKHMKDVIEQVNKRFEQLSTDIVNNISETRLKTIVDAKLRKMIESIK